MNMCERCGEEYEEGEIHPSKYFNGLFCIPCECEYKMKLRAFRIKFFNDQPERSKREDRDFDRRCHEFMDDIWESRMRCSEHDSNVVREVQ